MGKEIKQPKKWKLPITKRGLFFLAFTILIIIQIIAAIIKWITDYVPQ